MAVNQTSTIGAGVATAGLVISVSNSSSPETFQAIANASELKIPTLAEVVDVTNFGDLWRRRLPTLLDIGKIDFKIQWQMEDPSHNNSTPYGLRYLLINRILRDWQIAYPNGASVTGSFPATGSTDAFSAYVTKFEISGMVGKTFEASLELSTAGAPSFC